MKKIIAIILMGLLCLSLCACSVDESVKSENNIKENYGVGEMAEQKDVSVTLVDVFESNGAEFLEPAEGNVFVFCEFNIVNNSDSELTVSSLMNFDAYFDDESSELSITALSSTDKKQLDGTVAAGKKLSGVVAYEVPADWGNVEIHYTPDILKEDKLIFVADK